jgi:putative membrane protein
MSSDDRQHDDHHAHDHSHDHGQSSTMSRAWATWRRWQGIVLASAVLVSTLWLALTDQLVLYIHPRYVVFTVAMAAVGFAFVLASFIVRRGDDAEEVPGPVGKWASFGASVLALALAIAVIAVPPATLTTATASQREINSTALGAPDSGVSEAAESGAFATFTVLDWASLLRQSSDRSFYSDKPVDVLGFVTPDADDPDNVFYVSRFKVTCCAVDAQPVGVPVYLPGWQDQFEADEWVQVAGNFDTNPSRSSAQPLALVPADIESVEQPGEPYLY